MYGDALYNPMINPYMQQNLQQNPYQQQQAMTEIAGEIAAKYMTNFENCNYTLAKDILKKERTKYDNRGKKGLYNIKSAAAFCYKPIRRTAPELHL